MNHHRQTACFLLTACFLTVGAVAQTPQRTDIGSLLDPMPKLPATTQDALTMPANDRYLPYADQMNDLLEKTKQSNPTTVRVQKQAVATDTKIKAGVSWLLTNPAEDQRIRLNALQQRQRHAGHRHRRMGQTPGRAQKADSRLSGGHDDYPIR